MYKIQPRPGILDIEPYVPGNIDKIDPDETVYLASNESPLGACPTAIVAFKNTAHSLHRYPDNDCIQLREEIANRYALQADQIICGSGSERLIDLLIRSYAGPGDEVLYSEYGFLMYPICSLAAGATPVTAAEKNYTTDVDALLAAVTHKTKLVFVANPNNPTGSCISADELKRLRAQLPAQVILVIDSAYAEYVDWADYSAGHELVNAQTANVVVLHTFSKAYGLAALRLGWAYCPPAIFDVLNRVRGSFTINAAAQAAGIAALQDTEHLDKAIAHNQQWLAWMNKELTNLGLTVLPSKANFVLARFQDAETCQAAHRFLLERNVITRTVDGYKLPEALRITIGLAAENQACVNDIRDYLA